MENPRGEAGPRRDVLLRWDYCYIVILCRDTLIVVFLKDVLF